MVIVGKCLKTVCSDLKRKEALEHELRKELQEMRHRFEQQKLELTSEIERQKT